MRITIDGNVGAGKTTLVMALADWLAAGASVARVLEPVAEWERSGLLAEYYADRTSALAFQKMVVGRYAEAWNGTEADYVLADRSELGHMAMASVALADDAAALAEYRAYASVVCGQMAGTDLRMYLDEEPEVCAARAAARGRASEQNLGIDWFRAVGAEQRRMAAAVGMPIIRTLEEAQALIKNQRLYH